MPLPPDPATSKGLRVFTCGHSFHAFVPDLLADMTAAAGITEHVQVGVSAIGRSEALFHWDVPEAQNAAKRALRTGEVDVLTMSCMAHMDDGIGHFARLAVAHNPAIRVHLQALWLPEDRYPFDAANRVRTSVEQFNATTMAELREVHARYFAVMEAHVHALNAELGRRTVYVAPDALATMALRERIIAGTAPGLTLQQELFLDPWGHASNALRLLAAYVHFAMIYHRSPEGLPVHATLSVNPAWGAELNLLLQQLAWQAATSYPMSGVAG